MKNSISILFFLIIAICTAAQPPKLFKYQGIARDSTGNPVSNDTIALRISIHQGTAAGVIVYKETHNPITNEFGSFNINIGGGTLVLGNFATIAWGRYNYFQEVEMDITGGTSYVSMGTSQYLSVPYALSADSARFGTAPFSVQNNAGVNDLTSVAIIAMASGPAPAIFAKNLDSGLAILAESNGKSLQVTSHHVSRSAMEVKNDGGGQSASFFGDVFISGNITADIPAGKQFAINGNGGVGGNFNVNGNLNVSGTLSKSAGSFRIDHPLDPKNKFLYHSFVESPDMKNIYDGTVTTDAHCNATIEMPSYFEALNKDFRYQLTAIGQFAQAIVSKEISNNKFSIKTDKPNVKISWQITGIRKDAYAEKNRIVPEVEKEDSEKGKYLYPDCYLQAPAKKQNK